MKNRDVIQKIKQQVDSECPDIYSKIPFHQTRIESPAPKKLSFVLSRRWILAPMMVVIFLAASFFLFFDGSTNTVYALENTTEELGYQVLSGAMFLQNQEPVDLVFPLQAILNNDDTFFESDLNDFSQAFAILESFVGSKEGIHFQKQRSDLDQYSQMIQVTLTDLEGNIVEYQIYLNQRITRFRRFISGMVTYQDYRFEFEFTKLQGTPSTQLTLSLNDRHQIKIQRFLSNQSIQMKYIMLEDLQPVDQFQISLSRQNGQVQASMIRTKNNQTIILGLKRVIQDEKPILQIEYRYIENEQITETGVAMIERRQDQETQKSIYQVEIRTQVNGREIIKDIIQNRPNRGKPAQTPGNNPH